MATRTCKVGVHGRNDADFRENDYAVLRQAKIEAIKMMSLTKPEVFARIKADNPGIEIITRLHDNRINDGNPGHPTAGEFVERMAPIMAALRPYCQKYQVANEPNHVKRYEGWGATDEDARNFNSWFLEVYAGLKQAHPWASIGFPGLAVGDADHRESDWLRICRPAIQRADWLGVHCYWQTRPDGTGGLLDGAWGLRFELHHKLYPDKPIEILECGNSNIQRPNEDPWPISEDAKADEYVRWLQKVFTYHYINSASFFLLSSQDQKNWDFFSWRTENDFVKPVVNRIGDISRPPLVPVQVGVKEQPTVVRPVLHVKPMPLGLTNQMVINAFNRASLQLGLGGWGLMNRAGLSLGQLAAQRTAPYTGPLLADMPKLTDDQRRLVRAQLPDNVSFAPAGYEGFLVQDAALWILSLAYPRPVQIRKAEGAIAGRVARVWNRYGSLLNQIAERLGVDLEMAVAALAASCDPRGPAADGRMRLRFDAALFYERWGRQNAERFAEHFRFEPTRPALGQQWRSAADAGWQHVHGSHAGEWAAFDLARSLDQATACEAAELGFPRLLGASYALVGYVSAAQMCDAFASSERFQVLAFFDLLAGRGASSREAGALRQRDAKAFAALHAGPGDAARYAITLQEAIAAFRRFNPLR